MLIVEPLHQYYLLTDLLIFSVIQIVAVQISMFRELYKFITLFYRFSAINSTMLLSE